MYYLLRHAQRLVQVHINKKCIGVNNTASFRLSYTQQFSRPPTPEVDATTRRRISPSVEEFQCEVIEGETLPSLSVRFGDANDFRAVVEAVFARNFENHSFTFSCSFKIGTGGVLELDVDG